MDQIKIFIANNRKSSRRAYAKSEIIYVKLIDVYGDSQSANYYIVISIFVLCILFLS